jgi:hypothetical protein
VTTIFVTVDGVSAGIVGSNHAGAWMSAAGKCCVLSGRGLHIGLMTHSD